MAKPLFMALLVFWTAFMSWLLLTPGSSLEGLPALPLPWADKWVHAGLFAVWAFLWVLALGWHRRMPTVGNIRALLTGILAYGALTELAQYFWVAGRSGQPADFMADTAGALLGMWPVWRNLIQNRGFAIRGNAR